MKILSLFAWLSRPKKVEPPHLTEEQVAINRAFYKLQGRYIANSEIVAAHHKISDLNMAIVTQLTGPKHAEVPSFHMEKPVDISLKLLLKDDTLTFHRETDGYTEFWLTPEDIADNFGPVVAAFHFRGLQLMSVTLRERRNSLDGHYLVFVTERLAAAA